MISINNFGSCFDCDIGVMVKPSKIHSYDYIEDGYVPSHCNECGICSDCREGTKALKRKDRENCSNHNIKKGLKILCNRQRNFSYNTYNELFYYLKSKEIKTTDVLISLAIDKFRELSISLNEDFVRSTFAFTNM